MSPICVQYSSELRMVSNVSGPFSCTKIQGLWLPWVSLASCKSVFRFWFRIDLSGAISSHQMSPICKRYSSEASASKLDLTLPFCEEIRWLWLALHSETSHKAFCSFEHQIYSKPTWNLLWDNQFRCFPSISNREWTDCVQYFHKLKWKTTPVVSRILLKLYSVCKSGFRVKCRITTSDKNIVKKTQNTISKNVDVEQSRKERGKERWKDEIQS